MHTEDIQRLHFYQTSPHPCSYLAGQEARTLFVDPAVPVTEALYSRLITAGFRRSGEHLYRPACDHCQACLSCRVRVREFAPNKRFRRVWNSNQDLHSRLIKDLDEPQFFELYCRYINTRHAQGDMYPPALEQFQAFIAKKTDSTQFHGFFLEDRLVALCVIDELDHGLSAMYSYFDPELQQRSLGTYMILWQIEKARRLNLPYVYLGYWIRDCNKMRYKTDFRPLELLVNEKWVLLT